MATRSLLTLSFSALSLSSIDTAIAGSAIASSQALTLTDLQGSTYAAAYQAAKPINGPATWFTALDLPNHLHDEGIVHFRLLIDRTGNVARCEIVQSSGSEILDRITCRTLTRRARFSPATNSKGKAIKGSYENKIRWAFPEQ